MDEIDSACLCLFFEDWFCSFGLFTLSIYMLDMLGRLAMHPFISRPHGLSRPHSIWICGWAHKGLVWAQCEAQSLRQAFPGWKLDAEFMFNKLAQKDESEVPIIWGPSCLFLILRQSIRAELEEKLLKLMSEFSGSLIKLHNLCLFALFFSQCGCKICLHHLS